MGRILKDAVSYSKERISLENINLKNYVTTDNLLQNKQGKVNAVNLPPQGGNVTKFNSSDILIANIRPYLKKIWFAKHGGGSSADVLTFKVKSDYDPEFIYYALFRDEFFEHMMNGAKGTKMPRGDKTQVLDFPIPNFKKQTQQKIAHVLSTLDAKIDLNNRINRELEAMAKLLYDYWFVQFDFPDAEGKPYKSSGGKMVYSEVLKREVPAGWEVGVLGDVADLVRGVTYNKKDIKSSDDGGVIPILRATNINGNVVNLEKMVYVPDEFVSEGQILKKFDILITMSSGSINHIGKNGLFYFKEKVAFGAFCAKISAKERFTFFLYLYMQSEFVSATIKNECLGTNINNLNNSLVKQFRLVIPPINLIKKFNDLSEPIFKRIGNNQIESQKLEETRDWLLPMLMNGQVRVGE